jgi:hypothetical protein
MLAQSEECPQVNARGRAATFDTIRQATSKLGGLIKLNHYFNNIRLRSFVLNCAPKFSDIAELL